MSIIDNYKKLQMIENIKKIKEMELCYKSNIKLCKQQEKQINKLATCIEEIKDIAEYEFKELMNAEDYHNMTEVLKQILQKISEVENE